VAPGRDVVEKEIAVGYEHGAIGQIYVAEVGNDGVVVAIEKNRAGAGGFAGLAQEHRVAHADAAAAHVSNLDAVAVEDHGFHVAKEGNELLRSLDDAGGMAKVEIGYDPDWLFVLRLFNHRSWQDTGGQSAESCQGKMHGFARKLLEQKNGPDDNKYASLAENGISDRGIARRSVRDALALGVAVHLAAGGKRYGAAPDP